MGLWPCCGGKLGWRRFIPLYLAMGLMDGCACDLLTLYRTDEWAIQNVFGMENRAELEQTLAEEADITDAAQVDELLLAAKGGCLGASSVIFALMAISLVWAPKNELQFVGFVFMHVVSFDITIMMFSFFYIGLTFLLATIEQFGPDSSTLHLLGIIQGLIVGTVYYFRAGWTVRTGTCLPSLPGLMAKRTQRSKSAPMQNWRRTIQSRRRTQLSPMLPCQSQRGL